jgi:SPP1 family phage portal protein
MKILSDRTKDELYPIFSETGDMIAFCRKYTVKVKNSKDVDHFDIYTAEKNVYLIKEEGGSWALDEKQVESTGKIHVVYWKLDQPDWHDVQSMIDRLETTISNTGDSNDYSGSPITVVEGKVQGFASKGERGKVLEVEKGGSITYLEADNAPESIKLEIETLDSYIKEMTQTPNMTVETIKGLGSVSGIALKLLFTDAHSKAARLWSIFGEGIQRRLNLLKHICGAIDASKANDSKLLTINPMFTPYLPEDEESWNKMVTESLALGAISKQTAAENLTFVADPVQEIQRIKEEAKEDLGGSAA